MNQEDIRSIYRELIAEGFTHERVVEAILGAHELWQGINGQMSSQELEQILASIVRGRDEEATTKHNLGRE